MYRLVRFKPAGQRKLLIGADDWQSQDSCPNCVTQETYTFGDLGPRNDPRVGGRSVSKVAGSEARLAGLSIQTIWCNPFQL